MATFTEVAILHWNQEWAAFRKWSKDTFNNELLTYDDTMFCWRSWNNLLSFHRHRRELGLPYDADLLNFTNKMN
jgi:hypothetical protein